MLARSTRTPESLRDAASSRPVPPSTLPVSARSSTTSRSSLNRDCGTATRAVRDSGQLVVQRLHCLLAELLHRRSTPSSLLHLGLLLELGRHKHVLVQQLGEPRGDLELFRQRRVGRGLLTVLELSSESLELCGTSSDGAGQTRRSRVVSALQITDPEGPEQAAAGARADRCLHSLARVLAEPTKPTGRVYYLCQTSQRRNLSAAAVEPGAAKHRLSALASRFLQLLHKPHKPYHPTKTHAAVSEDTTGTRAKFWPARTGSTRRISPRTCRGSQPQSSSV